MTYMCLVTFCHGQKRGSLRGLKEVVFEQLMLVVRVFVVDSVNAIENGFRRVENLKPPSSSQCVAQNIWMSLEINFSLRFYLINNNTNVFSIVSKKKNVFFFFFLNFKKGNRNSYKF